MLMKPHFDYCRPLAVELGDKATEELNAAERQAFKMMFSIGRSVKNEWWNELMKNTDAVKDQEFMNDTRCVINMINRTNAKNGD